MAFDALEITTVFGAENPVLERNLREITSNIILRLNSFGGDLAALEASFADHSARHENGGADEISVAGLSGLLGDAQTPLAHKDTHDPEDGADPLDCAAASEIAGVQAAAEGSAHSFARSDHAHQIQHGISDNHIVTVDASDVAADRWPRWTGSGLDGLTTAEAQTALGLPTINSGVFVIMDGDQNITEDVISTIEFDDLEYDYNGDFNTGTYTFTAPETGLYLVFLSVYLQPAGDQHTYQLRLGGTHSGGTGMYYCNSSGTSNQTLNASWILQCNVTETITGTIEPLSDDDIIHGGSINQTKMWIKRMV